MLQKLKNNYKAKTPGKLTNAGNTANTVGVSLIGYGLQSGNNTFIWIGAGLSLIRTIVDFFKEK